MIGHRRGREGERIEYLNGGVGTGLELDGERSVDTVMEDDGLDFPIWTRLREFEFQVKSFEPCEFECGEAGRHRVG